MRTPSELYETDFYAWTQAQARELRRLERMRPNSALDLAHLAEEIRDLGRSERNAVFGLTRQVIQHLLLLEHAPATRPRRQWADEVDGFRPQIKDRITPTIRRHLARKLDELFAEARDLAERKLRRHDEHEAADSLPPTCPYSLDQILGNWLPAEGGS
jgi:hypothetical protein